MTRDVMAALMTEALKPVPRERLCDGDVQDLKPEGWWGDDGNLFRVFTFENYLQGAEFAQRVAELAEAQDHHPDILLTHRRVKVNYFTHDVGGVTPFDLRGAQAVNSLYALFLESGQAAQASKQPGSPGPVDEA